MLLRLILLCVLIMLDLFLMPAAARLPEYLSLAPGHSERMTRWRQVWLTRPLHAAETLLHPQSAKDTRAREGWLWLQLVMAIPALAILWPGPGLTKEPRGGIPAPDPSGARGTSRWRTTKELASTLARVRISNLGAQTGLLLGVDRAPAMPLPGKTIIVWPWQRPRAAYLQPGPPANGSVLIIGSPGSHKTRGIVLPNLWLLGQAKAAGKPSSIVVSDPKGELYQHTATYFEQLGYQVRTLNLIDPRRSDGYDPLAEVVSRLKEKDLSGAAELAWDVAHTFSTVESARTNREDPIWRQGSESLIAASILYVARHAPEGQRTMPSVYRLIAEYGQEGGQRLDYLFRAIEDVTDPARQAYAMAGMAQDRTRSSIMTTVMGNLRLFADPSIVSLTSKMDYGVADVGTKPTVVFLLLPDDRSARNPIAAAYLAQTYTALSRLAARSPGGRLPVETYWILDEFANLGQFRDFDKWLAVMRGRGMAAMVVLQAFQQLEACYGEDVARVISGSCETWLYLRSNDRLTAEELSKKLGQYTIRTHTHSSSTRAFDLNTSTSEHLDARWLQTADEILRWPRGSALVMQAGQHPARLRIADLSLWSTGFLAGGPPPERPDTATAEPWLPDVPKPLSFVRRVHRKPAPTQDRKATAQAADDNAPDRKELKDLSIE